MTAITLTGAASACKTALNWQDLSWEKLQKQVLRLQMRIAKAVREGRMGKVKPP